MEVRTNVTNINSNLSYTELNAIRAIREELEGKVEKIIVVSTIADGKKITRSVCASALRTLEACGVLSTQSLGMKGLHVQVLNQEAFAMIG